METCAIEVRGDTAANKASKTILNCGGRPCGIVAGSRLPQYPLHAILTCRYHDANNQDRPKVCKQLGGANAGQLVGAR